MGRVLIVVWAMKCHVWVGWIEYLGAGKQDNFVYLEDPTYFLFEVTCGVKSWIFDDFNSHPEGMPLEREHLQLIGLKWHQSDDWMQIFKRQCTAHFSPYIGMHIYIYI